MGTRTYSRRSATGQRVPTALGISTGKFTGASGVGQELIYGLREKVYGQQDRELRADIRPVLLPRNKQGKYDYTNMMNEFSLDFNGMSGTQPRRVIDSSRAIRNTFGKTFNLGRSLQDLPPLTSKEMTQVSRAVSKVNTALEALQSSQIYLNVLRRQAFGKKKENNPQLAKDIDKEVRLFKKLVKDLEAATKVLDDAKIQFYPRVRGRIPREIVIGTGDLKYVKNDIKNGKKYISNPIPWL